jgi:DnaJ family protein C protein 25
MARMGSASVPSVFLIVLAGFFILNSIQPAEAFFEGLYCGLENCYDVLNITRDTPKSKMSKIYRRLAAKYHPDRYKDEEAKKDAEKRFRVIATAYETLKDDDSRKDYDYMLDNPEEMYRHYWYYYRRRYAPKVDVRIVILVTIVAVSIVQYISSWHKYNEAISYLMTEPKYRIKALELAKERGLLNNTLKKGKKKQAKEEIKKEEEGVIRFIIEENMDIKGGYQRPSLLNVAAVQIVFLPYYAALWVWFYGRWVWKFWICREEFGDEEKLYKIRKWLKMSQAQFDSQDEKEIREYFDKELWIWENFEEWKAKKDEAERQRNLERGSYKRYRRYMKSGGPGQISFVDEE